MIKKTWQGAKILWKGFIGAGFSWLVVIGFILLTYGNKKEIEQIDWSEEDWVE